MVQAHVPMPWALGHLDTTPAIQVRKYAGEERL
jgi:hypothetical protein